MHNVIPHSSTLVEHEVKPPYLFPNFKQNGQLFQLSLSGVLDPEDAAGSFVARGPCDYIVPSYCGSTAPGVDHRAIAGNFAAGGQLYVNLLDTGLQEV